MELLAIVRSFFLPIPHFNKKYELDSVFLKLTSANFYMRFTLLILSIFLLGFILLSCSDQPDNLGNNVIFISPEDSHNEIIEKVANLAPSKQQLNWQQYEMTAFVCFNINTFTDLEWGDGTEDPQLFNPEMLDVRQWVRTIKESGMKMLIITAKHHDGFCLWPSAYTEHTVEYSPWENGKGDVIKLVAEACKEFGIKLGIYLSPWDRHEQSYGTDAYNTFFKNQLSELLTNYGDVAEVWFDGACGEGPNGKKQVYDWDGYYEVVRKLQPNSVIAVSGPDIRWVGTESGYGRETEWSVVPANNLSQDLISGNSQKNLTVKPEIEATEEDLGSREKILKAKSLVWYPSEVDVSIRPGWFYHNSQDDQVKSPEKLLDIYFSSVGRNSLLLLNVPPDKRGLIHENDLQNLKSFRRILDQTFTENLASEAKILPDVYTKIQKSADLFDQELTTFWTSKKTSREKVLDLILPGDKVFDVLLLQENIRMGQRVEKFVFEILENQSWKIIADGTTIGYKRLLRFEPVKAKQVRLRITESRTNPTLAEFGLYKLPPSLGPILSDNSDVN